MCDVNSKYNIPEVMETINGASKVIGTTIKKKVSRI